MGPVRQPAPVSTDALAEEFERRLNSRPKVDSEELRRAELEASMIPDITMDESAAREFSRPVTEEEIGKAKKLLKEKMGGSPAKGADGVANEKVLRLGNEDIARLINTCLDEGEIPAAWLATVLVGIPKPGKDRRDPASYRVIGLESCVLKFMMMIIAMRATEFSDNRGLIPESQNGFRSTYRTNNNSFILRSMVDRARAEKRTLWATFVDLKNAFPTTNLSVLWLKMYRHGAGGKIFDWVRKLYSEMRYWVRKEGEVSEAFRSLVGLLTGDNTSPGFWNIFFADLVMPPQPHDVVLNGMRVSHLEQADDLLLVSWDRAELQANLRQVDDWCSRNGMEVSGSKSKWMWFGKKPAQGAGGEDQFELGGQVLEEVDTYRYVGITFANTPRKDTFHEHLANTATRARSAASMMLGSRSMLGDIPPHEARQLYMSKVDPLLILGCEVTIDRTKVGLQKHEQVQKTYLRRVLGVSDRSARHVLYSEMGVVPIRFRRLSLALRYLGYLQDLPNGRLARAALEDSKQLRTVHHAGWYHELVDEAAELQPKPVHVEGREPGEAAALVLECAQASVQAENDACGRVMLGKRKGVLAEGKRVREYLKVPNPRHRIALTRLIVADHRLGVELGRRGEARVEREERLCRWCHEEVEDELHVLWKCPANEEMLRLRAEFLRRAKEDHIYLARDLQHTDQAKVLGAFRRLLEKKNIVAVLAKYAHDVMVVMEGEDWSVQEV